MQYEYLSIIKHFVQQASKIIFLILLRHKTLEYNALIETIVVKDIESNDRRSLALLRKCLLKSC